MSEEASLSARRLKLKLALEDLREMKGFGTELVTLIIPPDRQIHDARTMLQNEHGQAANIKSKGTRKNVQGAIESAISTLSRYKTPGENGIAIFVGSKSRKYAPFSASECNSDCFKRLMRLATSPLMTKVDSLVKRSNEIPNR